MKWTPVVTLLIWLATATTTALQHFLPSLQAALDRRPGAFAHGEWWRLLTALFVHNEGWRQWTLNLGGLAVLGTVVERRVGRLHLLVIYFVPGVIGEWAGMIWKPSGAGASVAVAGLMGAVIAWLVFGKWPWRVRLGASLGILGAVFLTVHHDLHGPPLLAGMAIGSWVRPASRAGVD
jgi:membrane associated rhomboid family serine protease